MHVFFVSHAMFCTVHTLLPPQSIASQRYNLRRRGHSADKSSSQLTLVYLTVWLQLSYSADCF